MKLYYMPGACSIGIHVLLEEIGKPYDLQKIDGAKQEQYGPDFVKLNPKSKVPTLQKDDGSVLTEFPAIATWLARKNPEKGLLPPDADGEAKALEGKDYVAGQFSVADAALFYVTFWAAGRMKMPLPKNVAGHYERMKSRPAVKRTVEQEGLTAAA